jgi:hypothetical protein
VKNLKNIDDLLVKAVYCVLLDEKKLTQQKGSAAVSAAHKLAQLEEQRREKKAMEKATPTLPPKRSDTPKLSRGLSSGGGLKKDNLEASLDSIAVSAPTGFRHMKSAKEILAEFDQDFALMQKRPQSVSIAEAQRTMRGSSGGSSGVVSPSGPLSPKGGALSPKSGKTREQILQEKMDIEARLKAVAEEKERLARAAQMQTDGRDEGLLAAPDVLSPKGQRLADVMRGIEEEEEEEEEAIGATLAGMISPRGQRLADSIRNIDLEEEVEEEEVVEEAAVEEKEEEEEEEEEEETGDLWNAAEPKYDPVNDTCFCIAFEDIAGEKEGDLNAQKDDVLLMNSAQDFSEEWWFGTVSDRPEEPGYFPKKSVKWRKHQ